VRPITSTSIPRGKSVTERKPAYCKPLKNVLPRLELLGHTLAAASEEYDSLRQDFKRAKTLPFDKLVELMKRTDVTSVSADYSDNHDFGEFFAEEMVSRLRLGKYLRDLGDRRYFGEMMENFHPWSALRMLAEREENLDVPVTWYFADIVDGGWEELESFVPQLSQDKRFLLVTEGGSDAKILRKAIDLLLPSTNDFFYFVDMEEGYPFSGTGNLAKFCNGLVSIGVLNNVLVIFDNDAEGVFKAKQVLPMNRPPTMGVMVLPDLAELRNFETVGPGGVITADINGRAASIEAYLDLSWNAKNKPMVRWSAYQEQLDCYQGALTEKDHYKKQFLSLRSKGSGYDFRKLEIVINHIFNQCVQLGAGSHKVG